MYLTDFQKQDVKAFAREKMLPSYRAEQIWQWLVKGARPEEMKNIPSSVRDALQAFPYGGVCIERELVSKKDGTKKYLFRLDDGNLVEGVLMRYKYGNTLCLSTQVGCRMGCKFCASTLEGCVRNLRPGEMLGFIRAVEASEPSASHDMRTVTNLVLMGSGEPLDNFDNVVTFLKRVTDPEEGGISPRNISLSTCGLVPKMYEFPIVAPHITLSVSLHAHNDLMRREIMPIANKYSVREVVNAAKSYAESTGRRVVFEYALVSGFNDSKTDAEQLSRLLKGFCCHVNLIPLNSVAERNMEGCTREHATEFMKWLNDFHISATVRREMGADIEGACGQLRRSVLHEEQRSEC